MQVLIFYDQLLCYWILTLSQLSFCAIAKCFCQTEVVRQLKSQHQQHLDFSCGLHQLKSSSVNDYYFLLLKELNYLFICYQIFAFNSSKHLSALNANPPSFVNSCKIYLAMVFYSYQLIVHYRLLHRSFFFNWLHHRFLIKLIDKLQGRYLP